MEPDVIRVSDERQPVHVKRLILVSQSPELAAQSLETPGWELSDLRTGGEGSKSRGVGLADQLPQAVLGGTGVDRLGQGAELRREFARPAVHLGPYPGPVVQRGRYRDGERRPAIEQGGEQATQLEGIDVQAVLFEGTDVGRVTGHGAKELVEADQARLFEPSEELLVTRGLLRGFSRT